MTVEVIVLVVLMVVVFEVGREYEHRRLIRFIAALSGKRKRA